MGSGNGASRCPSFRKDIYATGQTVRNRQLARLLATLLLVEIYICYVNLLSLLFSFLQVILCLQKRLNHHDHTKGERQLEYDGNL